MDEREEWKELFKEFVDLMSKHKSLLPAPKGSGVVRIENCKLCINGSDAFGYPSICSHCNGSGVIETELSESELCEIVRMDLKTRGDANLPDGSKLRLKH